MSTVPEAIVADNAACGLPFPVLPMPLPDCLQFLTHEEVLSIGATGKTAGKLLPNSPDIMNDPTIISSHGREHAQAPYSKFKVGAALNRYNAVIYGANVESASYGLALRRTRRHFQGPHLCTIRLKKWLSPQKVAPPHVVPVDKSSPNMPRT